MQSSGRSPEELEAENQRLLDKLQQHQNTIRNLNSEVTRLTATNNLQTQLTRQLQDRLRAIGHNVEAWQRDGRTEAERTIRRQVSRDLGLDGLNTDNTN